MGYQTGPGNHRTGARRLAEASASTQEDILDRCLAAQARAREALTRARTAQATAEVHLRRARAARVAARAAREYARSLLSLPGSDCVD